MDWFSINLLLTIVRFLHAQINSSSRFFDCHAWIFLLKIHFDDNSVETFNLYPMALTCLLVINHQHLTRNWNDPGYFPFIDYSLSMNDVISSCGFLDDLRCFLFVEAKKAVDNRVYIPEYLPFYQMDGFEKKDGFPCDERLDQHSKDLTNRFRGPSVSTKPWTWRRSVTQTRQGPWWFIRSSGGHWHWEKRRAFSRYELPDSLKF